MGVSPATANAPQIDNTGHWDGLGSTGPDWAGHWDRLDPTGPDWDGLGPTGTDWDGLGMATGTDWDGLGRASGMDWDGTGTDLDGLGRTRTGWGARAEEFFIGDAEEDTLVPKSGRAEAEVEIGFGDSANAEEAGGASDVRDERVRTDADPQGAAERMWGSEFSQAEGASDSPVRVEAVADGAEAENERQADVR